MESSKAEKYRIAVNKFLRRSKARYQFLEWAQEQGFRKWMPDRQIRTPEGWESELWTTYGSEIQFSLTSNGAVVFTKPDIEDRLFTFKEAKAYILAMLPHCKEDPNRTRISVEAWARALQTYRADPPQVVRGLQKISDVLTNSYGRKTSEEEECREQATGKRTEKP